MNRRNFIRSALAGFALTTGLARAELAVEEAPLDWSNPDADIVDDLMSLEEWMRLEYKMNDGDWQESNVFTVPNDGYFTVVARPICE